MDFTKSRRLPADWKERLVSLVIVNLTPKSRGFRAECTRKKRVVSIVNIGNERFALDKTPTVTPNFGW